MCFSPEASFGAAAGLTAIGVVAYKKAEHSDLRLLAAIPFFFGVQQLMEGFVWLSNIYESWEVIHSFSTYAFLFFAWIIWPLFLPFSYSLLEKQKVRKKILLGLGVIGIFVATILTYILFSVHINGQIKDCSIDYNFNFQSDQSWIFSILYISTVVVPCLVSSLRKIWLLGIINMITYFVSKIYYHDQLISVWCFFAAISSVIILYVVIDERKKDQIVS